MTVAATILHNIGAYLKLTGINYQKDDSFITIDFAEISDAVGLGIASFVVDDKANNVFFIAENPFETIEGVACPYEFDSTESRGGKSFETQFPQCSGPVSADAGRCRHSRDCPQKFGWRY